MRKDQLEPAQKPTTAPRHGPEPPIEGSPSPVQETAALAYHYASLTPSSLSPADVLALQRTAGNAAVTRLLRQRAGLPRADDQGQDLELGQPIGGTSGGGSPLEANVQRTLDVRLGADLPNARDLTNNKVVQRKFLNSVGDQMPATETSEVINKFKNSPYYTRIQRIHGFTPDEIDQALSQIEEGTSYDVQVIKDESLNIYNDQTYKAVERTLLTILEKNRHQDTTSKLAEKRNLKLTRGKEDPRGGIDSELERVLNEFSIRQDEVPAKLTQGKKIFQARVGQFGDNTGVSMEHVMEFETTKRDVRYIRFVKSTRLLEGQLDHTVPGYVSYGKKTAIDKNLLALAKQGQPIARKKLQDVVEAALEQAAWSFDGPHKEFQDEPGNLKNVDTPGIAMSRPDHFPYILATRFIGILFDPNSQKVLSVKKYEDTLVEFGENHPNSPKKPIGAKPAPAQGDSA